MKKTREGGENMRYSFQSEMASQYGIDEAILIDNLSFWIRKNIANNKCYYEGRFWTYNSKKAFAKLFPFWTERQVRRIINNLKSKGAVYTGNFNKLSFDRTTWYALDDSILVFYGIEFERPEGDEPIDEPTIEPTEPIEKTTPSSVDEEKLTDSRAEEENKVSEDDLKQKGATNTINTHLTKRSNGSDRNVTMELTETSPSICPNGQFPSDQTVQPIPDSNKDCNIKDIDRAKSDKKPKPPREKVIIPYEKIVNKYNTICVSLPRVMKISDTRKRHMSKLYKALDGDMEKIEELFTLAESSEFLSGRNCKWTACNFDWLMNNDRPYKVLEGTYNRDAPPIDNTQPMTSQAKPSGFVNYDQPSQDKYIIHDKKSEPQDAL